MTNNLTFTYEEFNTILTQVEAVLNSRPIAPLETISEEGLETLTLGHFLLGHVLQSLSTHMPPSNHVSSIKRWNLLQKLTEEFWQQLKSDYLLHLNHYRKWLSPTPNLKKGDVVLCRDLGEFANHTWPLARIEEVHPRSDDRVRVVALRVGKKLLKRLTNTVILLVHDLEEQTTSSYPSNEISRDNSHPMDQSTHDSLQSSSPGPMMVQPLDWLMENLIYLTSSIIHPYTSIGNTLPYDLCYHLTLPFFLTYRVWCAMLAIILVKIEQWTLSVRKGIVASLAHFYSCTIIIWGWSYTLRSESWFIEEAPLSITAIGPSTLNSGPLCGLDRSKNVFKFRYHLIPMTTFSFLTSSIPAPSSTFPSHLFSLVNVCFIGNIKSSLLLSMKNASAAAAWDIIVWLNKAYFTSS